MTKQDAPHLLYVAWGYPPCRGGGVYRALATANAFAEKGWRVTVLTANRETFTMGTGIDSTLEAQIHPSITVVRVPFTSGAYQTDIRTWSFWRAHAPELWNGYRARKDIRSFPEGTYGGWLTPLEEAAVRIHRANPVGLTIGTANPHVDFTPGLRLHKDFGVPYVMDYRDAWQLDVFSGRRLTPPGSPQDTWETELVESAREVWFVNEPIRAWHAKIYPAHAEKMHVVANGYDADMAKFSDQPRPGREQGLVLGYIGTISAHVPMRELFDGWALARSRSPLLASSRIDIYGYLDHSGIPNDRILALLSEFREQGIRYLGPVGKSEIADTYHSFDALLLVLGTGKYVTSGKVFEYCATGLPVASIHDPGNAATEILEDSAAWIATPDLSAEAIAATLIALAERAVNQTSSERHAVQDWAAQYERSNQLLPRIRALGAPHDTTASESEAPR
ncbi:Glycosyltransferase involved in cell wall bisynthesis [Cryobacterium psychrotolerans]|uniref:Glycosyltransferase involved in cell wall bisynthesis n=1 Tax=Cryobacterium psychrotolerans TaxID=386301 RepID=A0A1G9CIS6_9MICO|nr:hypothetical protein [Cryobacterium psychrotolerans]TFD84271.1 glycosyl transferase [Cryobacterium psychrotolerans]SDK51496.1 Glycosyltransferase involved in cell wall bisynthesis [Cryobacterium psychrotolerans]